MVNLYLLQFRADFSVLRIRYVSSGVVVLVTFLVFSGAGIYSGYAQAGGEEIRIGSRFLAALPMLGALSTVLPVPPTRPKGAVGIHLDAISEATPD
jgi:hypothetical protein